MIPRDSAKCLSARLLKSCLGVTLSPLSIPLVKGPEMSGFGNLYVRTDDYPESGSKRTNKKSRSEKKFPCADRLSIWPPFLDGGYG